jgi:hypothetical protein
VRNVGICLEVTPDAIQKGARPDSTLSIDALVAQGIEQDGPNVKVGGSIPSGGTIAVFTAPERAYAYAVARREA